MNIRIITDYLKLINRTSDHYLITSRCLIHLYHVSTTNMIISTTESFQGPAEAKCNVTCSVSKFRVVLKESRTVIAVPVFCLGVKNLTYAVTCVCKKAHSFVISIKCNSRNTGCSMCQSVQGNSASFPKTTHTL